VRSPRRSWYPLFLLVFGALCLWPAAIPTVAETLSPALVQSFQYPASSAQGLTGNLVRPADSSSPLLFDSGTVAIGIVPVPLPEQRLSRKARLQGAMRSFFMRPTGTPPHVRLLLDGVADATGAPVDNTGNQLVIDAVVTPADAASTPPPFSVAFDIAGGTAFVDAPLPITLPVSNAVNVQVRGISVIDPDGNTFGVLGFQLLPVPPTPTARSTPTAAATPPLQGFCYVGPNCQGASFPAPQEKCCQLLRPNTAPSFATSWCPPDYTDPSTGQCLSGECMACPLPPPSPDCGDRPECSGACTVACPDGRIERGTCQSGLSCTCNATCPAPTSTPAACRVGQCFDPATSQCTGQACNPDQPCSSSTQVCDVNEEHCPCSPPPTIPPPPQGTICCQCNDPLPKCFDFHYVEVERLCPTGCQTVLNGKCDPISRTCMPPSTCSADSDCDDGNPCTRDRCTAGSCIHDCLCVGANACGPGPVTGTAAP
jgi:hypothetical protein